MANEFIGTNMIAGYGLQSDFGTAVELGTGDQICWMGPIVFDDVTENVQTCGGKRTSTRNLKRQPSASMQFTPPDFGQLHFLLYQLMGAITSDPASNAIRADGSVGYSGELTWESSPAALGTLLAALDGSEKLVELEGCQIKQMVFTIDVTTGVQIALDLIANKGYHSDQSGITNTSTQVAALTYRHTVDINAKVFPPDCILDRVWLAPREQSTFTVADKICPDRVVITIVNPYEDMHFSACSDGHQPQVISVRDWLYELHFPAPNSFAYHTYKATGQPLKIKVEAQGNFGGIGASVSAVSPSTDISGGTDTKFNVTLRRELADGQYETDGPHLITLTVAGLNSGDLIAAAIQTQLRAVTATGAHMQEAFDGATCDHDDTVEGKYVLLPTPTLYKRHRFIITDGASNNVADDLKIGADNGGTETASIPNAVVFMSPSCRVIETPSASIVESGYMDFTVKLQACANGVTSVGGFTTSDESRLESDFDTTGEEGRILIQSWSDYYPSTD